MLHNSALRTSSLLDASQSVGQSVSEDSKLLPLPDGFVEFLKRHGVDPSVYAAAEFLPRYVRLKPSLMDNLIEIERELSIQLEPVSWLPGFFSMPAHADIAWSDAYKKGKIYGMDAASGAAVSALDISAGDHVLDICAAPGAKLCLMADLLGSTGSLTGVDISRPRLSACRTMLQKYGLGNQCRLFLADGKKFSLLPLRETGTHHQQFNAEPFMGPADDPYLSVLFMKERPGMLGSWRLPRTQRERKSLRRAKVLEIKRSQSLLLDGSMMENKQPEIFYYGNDSGLVGLPLSKLLEHSIGDALSASEDGYDKVLVDAECTHDGSLKHICKFEQWGWDTFEKRFFNKERISLITDLQLQLLMNGFKLLKPGGTLIYSTCSFTLDQNEGVVERFVSTHPNAEIQEIGAAKAWPCKRSHIDHCVRFDPIASNTNGLFIAKFVKYGYTRK